MTQLEFDFGLDEPTSSTFHWNSAEWDNSWDTTKFIYRPEGQLMFGNITPDYNMCFTKGGKQIGKLDFNGPELIFTGDLAPSARVFLDYLAQCFRTRLEQEYNNGYTDGQFKQI